MSVHSPTGHDICLVGLTCCGITIGKLQFGHTFIVCKKSKKVLVISLDMKQLHHLGCNWTNDRQMFLHHRTNILINYIDAVVNMTNLKNN